MSLLRPATQPDYRLRPANAAAEGGASSVLRVARQTSVRSAPVLQRGGTPRQLVLDLRR